MADHQEPKHGRRETTMTTITRPGQGGAGGDVLLVALNHVRGVVLRQADVAAKKNEIPMFAVLLDRIGLAGAVVTADALHAQRAHAEYLAGRRGAHYLITVKGNQPGLHAQFAALPWRQVPAAHHTREQRHGRAERRTLKVTAVAAGLAFPHAA
jgi:predicted transposase YbfD/YdcC